MRLCLPLMLIAATAAHAYEFRLQLTAASGARNLVVAGYYFNGPTVVGNCSYDTVTSGSGRDPRSITTHHPNTCVWDLFGNLVSLTAGAAPAAPVPISQIGTEVVYAISGDSSTGRDTRGFGFVSTPSAHYTWETPNGTYAVIPDAANTIVATLLSDGDLPLQITSAQATPAVSGTMTPSAGSATVASTTCSNPIATGTACSLTVVYNPKTIKCTPSPYGYAYTRIDLMLVTNSGATTDFTQSFTITGVPRCDD